MKNFILILGLTVLMSTPASAAQIAPPNEAGVSMGHLHFLVPDVDAYKKFFITLGGLPTSSATAVKFPGVLVILMKGNPSGGLIGSVVNHIAFKVQSGAEAQARWKAAGLNIEPGSGPENFYVHSPDDLFRIEIVGDKSLTTPIAFYHIHFYPSAQNPGDKTAATDMQAWYAKTFGAIPGKRGDNDIADLTGVLLAFTVSNTPTAGTKGRVLDHIGFEVKDLDSFCKKLQADGVKLDTLPTARPDLGVSLAYLTDPWGTRIELTEGLNKL